MCRYAARPHASWGDLAAGVPLCTAYTRYKSQLLFDCRNVVCMTKNLFSDELVYRKRKICAPGRVLVRQRTTPLAQVSPHSRVFPVFKLSSRTDRPPAVPGRSARRTRLTRQACLYPHTPPTLTGPTTPAAPDPQNPAIAPPRAIALDPHNHRVGVCAQPARLLLYPCRSPRILCAICPAEVVAVRAHIIPS
jgi:hypothetical protein